MNFDFDIDAEEDCFFDSDPICDFPNLKKHLTDMANRESGCMAFSRYS